MRKVLLLTAILIGSLLTVSCGFNKDSFADLRVEAGISMPLGSIVLSDSSLFALAGDITSDLHINPETKVLYVLIDDSLALIDKSSFNSIFNFGMQNFQFAVSSGFTIPPVPGNDLRPIPDGVKQTVYCDLPNGERLDNMNFGSGYVEFYINNPDRKDFSQIKVTVDEIIDIRTGKPIVITFGRRFIISSFHQVKPTHSNDKFNGFTFTFSGDAPLVPEFRGNVTIQLEDLQSAVGFFGRKEILAPTITLSVSDEFEQFINMFDYLYFADPHLVFDILNQYDAPMLAKLDQLKISGEALELKEGFDSFFIPSKGRATFVLSNQNTVSGNQLSDLIGTDFKNFVVNVNAVMNPTQNDLQYLSPSHRPENYVQPTVNSFSITDSLFGSYAVTIPFDAILRNARFEQEIDLDMTSILGGSIDLSQFAFGFYGENSMPLDIVISAYVKEGNYKTMLFDNPVKIPASVSVNTLPAIPSQIEAGQMLVAEVKPEALKMLVDSKKIYFELATSTKGADAPSPEAVKIFSPSAIKLNVLVGTKLDLQLTGKGLAPQGKVISLSK